MKHNPEVVAWFRAADHPQEPLMLRVRQIILEADSRMSECIKWKTPTFMFEGNLASFNAHAKKHVSLLLHTGAKIPGRHPAIEGNGDTARVLKIRDLDHAEALKGDIEALVAAWCALKSGGEKKSAKKKSAKKKAVAKKKKTVAKKKAVAKKKTTAKKKTVAKKKAVAKKKTTTAKKKAVAKKKTAKKKAVAKKKTAQRKSAKPKR